MSFELGQLPPTVLATLTIVVTVPGYGAISYSKMFQRAPPVTNPNITLTVVDHESKGMLLGRGGGEPWLPFLAVRERPFSLPFLEFPLPFSQCIQRCTVFPSGWLVQFCLYVRRARDRAEWVPVAVGETLIRMDPPLSLVGVSTRVKRGVQQNDRLADG